MDQAMMQQGAQPPAAGMAPEQDATGTVEITLEVAPDGSLSVSQSSGDEQAEQKQPADDIGAALKMILEMYKRLGTAQASDQMSAGFSSNDAGSQRTQRGFR